MNTKKCSFITGNANRIKRYCKNDKYDVNRECPVSCGTCECEDTKFTLNNNKEKNCSWLEGNYARIERYCVDAVIADTLCPLACATC